MDEIKFAGEEHKKSFLEYFPKCRSNDTYHMALIYCLGINHDTREHVNQIYNFKSDSINPECLYEGWQTSGSLRVVRLAFNLYCSCIPTIEDEQKEDEKLKECERYTPDNLFCTSDAPFFWEAIKLRYPEFCSE